MSWSGPEPIHGDNPPMPPIRVVHLTPGQLRDIIRILNNEWTALDRERAAMTPPESDAAAGFQREIETILETLGQAL